MSEEKCVGCKFYESVTPEEDKEAVEEDVKGLVRKGICRVGAPQPVTLPPYVAGRKGDFETAVIWPMVQYDDWCGAFKPKGK